MNFVVQILTPKGNFKYCWTAETVIWSRRQRSGIVFEIGEISPKIEVPNLQLFSELAGRRRPERPAQRFQCIGI